MLGITDMSMTRRFGTIFGLLLGLLVWICPSVGQAQCALPNQLTNGQPTDATQVMANFNALANCKNLGTIQSYLATVQNQSAAYTLASTDCGTEIVVTVSATAAVTLPATLPIGCQVAVVQGGTAKITLSAASGAALESPHSFTGTFAQYSTIGAQVISNASGSAAVWVFTGDGS
jgi:hypothetical protein